MYNTNPACRNKVPQACLTQGQERNKTIRHQQKKPDRTGPANAAIGSMEDHSLWEGQNLLTMISGNYIHCKIYMTLKHYNDKKFCH
jgi:hypothetical protein